MNHQTALFTISISINCFFLVLYIAFPDFLSSYSLIAFLPLCWPDFLFSYSPLASLFTAFLSSGLARFITTFI
ncbi:hypothetical protein DU80_19670 [Methanosarcina mazei]|uniref:Uncharacterized protein n=2 Tax=Methanosarcina mazei TaxID=2209 RepID=A0A0F8DJS0_METMZ|nr:hypothetical protein MSMAW_0252 [Methanosarcina mazei WWM610]KKG03162.1 hypothetical protein DU40_12010 [Methanosarcina mazei]KKG05401.1 hypothetical protein DU47_02875 [Methanosarcina mazei]KKG17919.1 hypothetical protein DU34_09285 [Methanosarcina mazei]KKG28425.1 hypothetical protein DU49_10450 [Methanosarcina mazei]